MTNEQLSVMWGEQFNQYQKKQDRRRNMTETFRTKDIGLATHLYSNNVHLISIVPNGDNRATFVFNQPDQELIDTWLSGEVRGDTRVAVQAYRHLARDARIIINAERMTSPSEKESMKEGNSNGQYHTTG